MAVVMAVGLGCALGGAVSCQSKSGQAAEQAAAAAAEHAAADAAETEALLGEVRYLRVEATLWYVAFGLGGGGDWAPKLIGRSADKKNFENRVSAAQMIKPGDLFFPAKEPFKDRFRFTGFADKAVVSKRTEAVQTVTVAQFEDLRPNKAGVKYESQQGLPESEIEAHAYCDRTAILDFGKADGDRTEIKVEEGTSFPLPGASGKSCLLKEVTDEAIVIEYDGPGGARKVKSVPRLKGS